MTDTVSAETRSWVMSRVRDRDTRPELVVRAILRGLRIRFRSYAEDLPGKPDIVLPSIRTILFIQGCFWHGHTCKRGARVPQTNEPYWRAKITRNRTRDRAQARRLRALGWSVLQIWECSLRKPQQVCARLERQIELRTTAGPRRVRAGATAR